LAIWLPSLRAKPVSWPFQGKVSERLAFWNLGSIHNNTYRYNLKITKMKLILYSVLINKMVCLSELHPFYKLIYDCHI